MYSKVKVLEAGRDGSEQKVEKVFGTGNLTNDPPALRQTPGGKKVLSGTKGHNFSIAFNQGKNKETIFHRVEAWEKTAELLQQFAFKGQEIEVVGRLNVDKYKDHEGIDRVSETLVIEKFDVKKYKDNVNNAQSDLQDSTPTGESDPFAPSSEPIEVSDDLPF